MRIAFYTLGCKLNQYETKFLEQMAEDRGYIPVPFHTPADLYIINTCTVTAKSDLHARQFIRRAKRLNPAGKVIVTGCYAQRDPDTLLALPEVDLVLGNVEKERLFEYLEREFKPEDRVILTSQITKSQDTFYPLNRFSGYTRAFMKIQDGCDSACSYCIVPRVRGPSRSLDPQNVIQRFKAFLESGYREIVLTGVHIGKYGRDCQPETSLAHILETLLSLSGHFRIRLSSLEPPEFTDQLIDIFKKHKKLCPHFHVPLQSGDDDILRSMKRPYSTEFYENLIGHIKAVNPDTCIGADVITGYPGETDQHFENTYRFIQSLPISYLHVFSFSPRPGTAAFHMERKIPVERIKKRTLELRRLSIEKNKVFRELFIGRKLQTLVFSGRSPLTGLQKGLTENYIHLFFKGRELPTNEFHTLMIRNVQQTMTFAEV